jgi:putative DNA primase/helicase
MTVDQLLAEHGIKLKNTTAGRHYTTCPKCSAARRGAHRDNAVLGVTIEADGGVRWGCNHCEWTGPEKGAGNGHDRELQAYVYRDADGVPRFRKVRNAPGRTPRFWLERADGRGGWIKRTKDVNTRIVYRADEVKKAIAEGRIICCVEGEKDADNLWALRIAATCNTHGASEPGKRPKWIKAHSDQLAGADIVVLGDNDSAGYEHADSTCKLSLGIAKRVRRLDLAKHWPEIPKGGDISDWLARGHTREALEALIASAPDYVPTGQAKEARGEEQEPSAADAEITRLAKLPALPYEQQRKAAAERLDLRAAILDKLVAAERERLNPDDGGKQGHALDLPAPELWPYPVHGAELLDGITEAIRRYVILPEHSARASALWIVHTYLLDSFHITPRLAIRSPTFQCGKTTMLDVVSNMVLRPLPTANVTASAIFRVVEKCRPTLLMDEGDTFIAEAEELRGIVNSGHRRGGSVVRTVGEDHEPRGFSTYGAVAIAMIGKLPPTLHDRSVVIDLKRRLLSEKVTGFRSDRTADLNALARKAARWAADHAERIASVDPDMPEGIYNRAADNWRPLLAIADVAGGVWPMQAREDAQKCCAVGDDEEARLPMLLADIRSIFAGQEKTLLGETKPLPSAELVKALVAIEGRPWAEYGKGGKPITANKLAMLLKPLAIVTENIRVGDQVPKGYRLERFAEAFERYLPPEGAPEPLQRHNADEITTSELFQTATNQPDVADRKCEKPIVDGVCGVVADEKGADGEARASSPEVLADEPTTPCVHCGENDGRVYLIRNQSHSVRGFPLHEHCAPAWFEQKAGERTHTTASVPFMITQTMKAELRARGYLDEQIRDMTPQEANAILAGEPICQHCRLPATTDSPVQECWIDGNRVLLHRGRCQDDWSGPAPAGSRQHQELE